LVPFSALLPASSMLLPGTPEVILLCAEPLDFRQDYRDASTRPSAAGVTGILDPRRGPGCCAASRVDRLR
jgi:hypothetical protein